MSLPLSGFVCREQLITLQTGGPRISEYSGAVSNHFMEVAFFFNGELKESLVRLCIAERSLPGVSQVSFIQVLISDFCGIRPTKYSLIEYAILDFQKQQNICSHQY
jgi:hypothetical protein